ncbi:MAG: hypothetical protein FWE82_02340 [Defluviitaleaceae bacterium]|nr:hypothetical protein [Defluviitaleaceae bacterium]
MPADYTEYLNRINNWFESSFGDIYRKSSKKNRVMLLPYISNIYRRWLYSSLIEGTVLTPANLVEALNHDNARTPDSLPAVALKNSQNYSGMTFEVRECTLEHHPVVSDFKKFLRFYHPDIELSPDDFMDIGDLIRASENLSLRDPHYADYLFQIALDMGYLVKIPSVYSNRAQTAPGYESRLNAPDIKLLAEIVMATISNASCMIVGLMQLPETAFTESFLLSILKKPMWLDDIYSHVYGKLGINFFDGDGSQADRSSVNAAAASGSFLMGVVLDKFFFTPFSYYLQLIRPIYPTPFDFENELRLFIDTPFDADELYTAFFTPCVQYHLTELGLILFNCVPDSENFLNVKMRLPFKPVFEQLIKLQEQAEANIGDKKTADKNGQSGKIYEIRIKYEPNASLWLCIDVTEQTTLHRLYLELSAHFGLEPQGVYSFFADTTESPFTEYTSPQHARPTKKTNATAMADLNFEVNHKFVLVTHPGRNLLSRSAKKRNPKCITRLALEIEKIKPKQLNRFYPSVTRLSKAFREMGDFQE